MDNSSTIPPLVKVRILATGTLACGCVCAKGAVINLPQDKAETLEKLGKAKVLGI